MDEIVRYLLKETGHIAKQTGQNRAKLQNRIKGTQSGQSNYTSPDHNSEKQNPTKLKIQVMKQRETEHCLVNILIQ